MGAVEEALVEKSRRILWIGAFLRGHHWGPYLEENDISVENLQSLVTEHHRYLHCSVSKINQGK
jgi:hypothetical protein